MSLSNIPTTVLTVTGILSFAIVDGSLRGQGESQETSPSVSSAIVFTNIVHFESKGRERDDGWGYFGARCYEKGGLGTLRRFETATDQFKQCTTNLEPVIDVKVNAEWYKIPGYVIDVMVNYTVELLNGCVKRYLTFVGDQCMENGEENGLEVVDEMITSFRTFSDHGKEDPIKKFVNDRDMLACMTSYEEKLKNCFLQHFIHLSRKKDAVLDGIIGLLESVLKQGACDEQKSFRQCTVKIFESCGHPAPTNLVDGLFASFYNATGCGRSGDSETLPTRA